METHFLNLEITKLPLIGEIGVHAKHGESCPRIEIGDLGGKFVATFDEESLFKTRDAVHRQVASASD